jgi:hypothetical protein
VIFCQLLKGLFLRCAKFHKIHPVVVALIHVDRRTDGQKYRQTSTAKVLGTLCDYVNAPKVVALPGLNTEHTKYAYVNAVF